MSSSFNSVVQKYRDSFFSQRDKGDKFERLMKAYLLTDPRYSSLFQTIWLWTDFPYKNDLGGTDTGIDIVAITKTGEYWAIQCKFYKEDSVIDKPSVDTFITTSGRSFNDEKGESNRFSQLLWISTTNKWTSNAEESIHNQNPPLLRINLDDLKNSEIDWDKLNNDITGDRARTNIKKELREHQKEALNNTISHFKTTDRGKLIMACGTGKTFTSLRIAEAQTDGKGLILFLVPSIALLGQTLKEWCSDAKEKITAICICSDPEVSRIKTKTENIDTFSIKDLAFPASTNVTAILKQFSDLKKNPPEGLTVVFSTYQSIERISEAQQELEQLDSKHAIFDLIICDEAHRTTGVILSNDDESHFTKVHSNDFIKAKKRLYMTATPRLYSEETKSKAQQEEAILCSMDDTSLYGEEIYRLGFGEAVDQGLLTDYKVLILTLNENDIPPAVQNMIKGSDDKIEIDDLSKLIGCISSISKQILGDNGIIKETDPLPMRRAVAFCQSIKASKKITTTFNSIYQEKYRLALPKEQQASMQEIKSRHIDGTMNASIRNERLTWLKAEASEKECRVLTNVRCLSEGVDVPSLDAVLFLSAKNSQVDVVQSVGRVMRKSEGKKFGYIIIPVMAPSDTEAEKVLDKNKEYKVVWTVLNALKAHDDRFNAIVNKLDLNKSRPEQILVGRPEISFDERGDFITHSGDSTTAHNEISKQLSLQFEQLQGIIFGRMVQRVGDRTYWQKWAKEVGEVATKQIKRITELVANNPQHQQEFENFLKGLRDNLNPSVTKEESIEMLAQHIITKPVFDALFENYSFVENNPISKSMQSMLNLLNRDSKDADSQILQNFYQSVKTRVSGIDNAEGKQRIIIELYDKFFSTAFPKMVEKLGIVYTPVEVVDFIIHSVNDILKKEFDVTLSDENVHILDPFTGTGTFITRLLQSGLIKKEDLLRKYTQEIHCNEIVLLAYYIAAINIETTFHDLSTNSSLSSNNTHIPFNGICLTDTFQLSETNEDNEAATLPLERDMFPQNSDRVKSQKKAPLRVIIGNPPYSIGQKRANDNAQNQSYPQLDNHIAQTYSKLSSAGLKKSMSDAYIKAFRWSTDRLSETGGIICFVSNGSWLDSNSADGFRKSLENDFSSIYVFNLRGNQRTSGELSRKEGGKVFGEGSRTPITITLLVKKPS